MNSIDKAFFEYTRELEFAIGGTYVYLMQPLVIEAQFIGKYRPARINCAVEDSHPEEYPELEFQIYDERTGQELQVPRQIEDRIIDQCFEQYEPDEDTRW